MVMFYEPRENDDARLDVMCKLTSASAEIMLSLARLEPSSGKFAILEAIVEKLDEAAKELRKHSSET